MSKETKIFVLEEMQISLDSVLKERRKKRGKRFFFFLICLLGFFVHVLFLYGCGLSMCKTWASKA